ncbi:MAG: amino acid adenylation domain-containing protein [Gammaproteobacteria bacterium]
MVPADSRDRRQWSTTAKKVDLISRNSSIPKLPTEGNIVSWFDESCRLFPLGTAVETAEGSVSYRQLQERVRRSSDLLEQLKIGTGDVVAVLLADRVDLIATMISLFQRGSLFVPLDVDAPPERTKAIISNARPLVLLTDETLDGDSTAKNKRFGIHCPVVAIRHPKGDVLRPVSKKPSPVLSLKDRAPSTPAYIYYTSGSTGKPNGVLGSLIALSQFIRWEVETFSMEIGWRTSQLSSPTFDPFFRDIFVPLCTGGTVIIPPAEPGRMTPEDLAAWISRYDIHLVHTVPTLLAALADSDPSAGRGEGLRCMFVAGETLCSSVVKQWWKRFGKKAQLINLYGSTEMTMVKLFHIVSESDLKRPTTPIGKPIDGAEVILLDREDQECSPNSIGEICIRSPFLALGYFRNPELTEKTFTPDPFTAEPGPILYRSGDFGRELPGGALEFIGRKDDLVKIRGVRVEVGEVQSALERYPVVSEAAILVNGKVDRQLLGKMPSDKDDGPVYPIFARNDIEQILADIWCEVLGLQSVSVDENFFALGGHSLSAMRVASHWIKMTSNHLSMAAIFDHPTIAQLARYLSELDPADPRTNPSPPDPEPTAKRLCNLLIVVNEQLGRSSFEKIAEKVEVVDPAIRAFVVDDSPQVSVNLEERPTLVFSPALLRNRPAFRGHILCGLPMTKSEEYTAVATRDIPVPDWKLLSEEGDADLSRFPGQVVCKPNDGGKGAAVKLMSKFRVVWKPVFTAASGLSDSLIVQRFIYTGPRPNSYRVSVLFGQTLYAVRLTAGPGRPLLPTPGEMAFGEKPTGVSIVSNTPDSEIEAVYDQDIIELAKKASTAFPDIPLLGVDLLREEATGRLFVIEVNLLGYNWNFPGTGPRSFNFPIEEQFDGLTKAARLLAKKTQLLAAR